MFTMERNEKDPNLSKIETFFLSFYGSQGIAQNVEERKVDVFFITISIVIPAVQFLTQNIIKMCSKHSRTSTMKLSCEKAPSLKFDWAINMSLNWFLMTKLFY